MKHFVKTIWRCTQTLVPSFSWAFQLLRSGAHCRWVAEVKLSKVRMVEAASPTRHHTEKCTLLFVFDQVRLSPCKCVFEILHAVKVWHGEASFQEKSAYTKRMHEEQTESTLNTPRGKNISQNGGSSMQREPYPNFQNAILNWSCRRTKKKKKKTTLCRTGTISSSGHTIGKQYSGKWTVKCYETQTQYRISHDVFLRVKCQRRMLFWYMISISNALCVCGAEYIPATKQLHHAYTSTIV